MTVSSSLMRGPSRNDATALDNALDDTSQSLSVVDLLVLEPLAVAIDAADLLAVVVWHGIVHGLRRWVDSVAFDSSVELLFFL